MSFGDDLTEPADGVRIADTVPRDLVEQALALVELMSASEYVAFVETLYGAGMPRKPSRQLAAALELSSSSTSTTSTH